MIHSFSVALPLGSVVEQQSRKRANARRAGERAEFSVNDVRLLCFHGGRLQDLQLDPAGEWSLLQERKSSAY
jgi:hypothetical protein